MNEIQLFRALANEVKHGIIDHNSFLEYYDLIKDKGRDELMEIITQVKTWLGHDIYADVYIYSFINYVFPGIDTVRGYLVRVMNSDELTWENLYFLSQQISVYMFVNAALDDYELICLNWKLYKKAFMKCKEQLNMDLTRIPLSARNKNVHLVITDQFLTDSHGPTKTALDRCLTLKKNRGEVLLLNTAECLTPIGGLNVFARYKPGFDEKYSDYTSVEWKNVKISFFQCNYIVNIEIMRALLQKIIDLKPQTVTVVGSMSLFAGLVNELIPAVNISTTQSGIVLTMTDYQAVCLRKNDTVNVDNIDKLLEDVGVRKDHIINGKFTFSLKEQMHSYTRKQIGIEEKAFVLVIVGGRLKYEIDDKLLTMLDQCVKEYNDIRVMILGEYNNEKLPQLYGNLNNNLMCMGFCEDVLAYMENCDLYINPIRKGGGTSVVEALFKGVPAVAVDFGDVAGIAGDRFVCNSYDEMKDLIIKYYKDKDFYQEQSEYAKKLAEEWMDSDKEFIRIIDEYLRRQEV